MELALLVGGMDLAPERGHKQGIAVEPPLLPVAQHGDPIAQHHDALPVLPVLGEAALVQVVADPCNLVVVQLRAVLLLLLHPRVAFRAGHSVGGLGRRGHWVRTGFFSNKSLLL